MPETIHHVSLDTAGAGKAQGVPGTKNTAPSVAVIIPLWNAAGTIDRAVRSALAELEVAEVVVVDDCSPDDSVNCALACDDGTGRLKVLRQPENGGPSAARNRAIAESSAAWIALLDSDDFFLPGRIGGLLAYAGDADFIADDLWQEDEDRPGASRRLLLGESETLPRSVSFTDFVASNLAGRRKRERTELGFIKPLIRREFLERHAISYREDVRLGEDYELYARALLSGARLVLVPAQGYVSVIRSGSLSGRHTEEDLRKLRDCSLALVEEFRPGKDETRVLRRHYLDTDCRLQWRRLISAVRSRDTLAAFRIFLRPWPVPLYLAGKLGEQFWWRVVARRPSGGDAVRKLLH